MLQSRKICQIVNSVLYITENRIEKLLLVRLLLLLLFRPMVEKLRILFGEKFNISACTEGYNYELKFSRQTKFDTLMLNLNSL